jgi:hypothetical protein
MPINTFPAVNNEAYRAPFDSYNKALWAANAAVEFSAE